MCALLSKATAELCIAVRFFFDALLHFFVMNIHMYKCIKMEDNADDVLMLLTATYCVLIAHFLSGRFLCNDTFCHDLLN